MTKTELALLEMFSVVDTVFQDEPAFAKNHQCPASVALARIYRDYIKCRAVIENNAEVYGKG